MTVLEEMQFELLPSLDAATGTVFGIGANVEVDDGGFLPGDDDWSVEDEPNPRRGGVAFGRDTLNGPTWGFNLHVNETSVATAVDTLGAFKTAWRALHIRQTPGAIIPLRYRLNDRYRRVYGRPRRFSAPPANLILSGYIPVTTDFQCVDSYTYDDVQSVIQLSLQSGNQGGPQFPSKFPAPTIPIGTRYKQAVVGGDAPTYPIIRFTGPVVYPSLALADWTLSLYMTIENGSYVDIDLRPWAMSALLNGSSSVAGYLGRRQYLADMTLEPGPRAMVMNGWTNGYATCTVRWANAWNSY